MPRLKRLHIVLVLTTFIFGALLLANLVNETIVSVAESKQSSQQDGVIKKRESQTIIRQKHSNITRYDEASTSYDELNNDALVEVEVRNRRIVFPGEEYSLSHGNVSQRATQSHHLVNEEDESEHSLAEERRLRMTKMIWNFRGGGFRVPDKPIPAQTIPATKAIGDVRMNMMQSVSLSPHQQGSSYGPVSAIKAPTTRLPSSQLLSPPVTKFSGNLYVGEIMGAVTIGHLLFQYSALYAMAMATNRQPHANGAMNFLRTVFKRLSISMRPAPHGTHVIKETAVGQYDDSFYRHLAFEDAHMLMCCAMQSYKYFWLYESRLRREEFILHDSLASIAQKILSAYSAEWTRQHFDNQSNFLSDNSTSSGGSQSGKNSTLRLIGVFVDFMRNDIANTERFHANATANSIEQKLISYIYKAMQYYRQQYVHNLFIVVGNNDACANMTSYIRDSYKEDTVFLPCNDYGVNLAVLSQCHHSIVTAGPLSWWAGWLAGGQVTYYKGWPAKWGEHFISAYKLDDYYPPAWIGIEN